MSPFLCSNFGFWSILGSRSARRRCFGHRVTLGSCSSTFVSGGGVVSGIFSWLLAVRHCMCCGSTSKTTAYCLRMLEGTLSSPWATLVNEEVSANRLLGGLTFPRPILSSGKFALLLPLFLLILLSPGREFDLKKIHGGPETSIIANNLDICLTVNLRNFSGKSSVASD